MGTRLITGLGLGGFAAFSLYIGGAFPVLLALVAALLAAFEYWSLILRDSGLENREVELWSKVYSALVLSPCLFYYFTGLEGLLAGSLISFLFVCGQAIYQIESPIHEPSLESILSKRLSAFFYLVVFTNCLVLGVSNVEFSSQSALLWAFAIGVVAADSGAYLVGKALGKRKLAPRLSPGKTVEGLIGGLISGTAAIIAIIWFSEIDPSLKIFLFSLSLPILSVVGDLFQSALKRQLGVKDSGDLLPGHGGVFDRIDSWLFASPLLLAF